DVLRRPAVPFRRRHVVLPPRHLLHPVPAGSPAERLEGGSARRIRRSWRPFPSVPDPTPRANWLTPLRWLERLVGLRLRDLGRQPPTPGALVQALRPRAAGAVLPARLRPGPDPRGGAGTGRRAGRPALGRAVPDRRLSAAAVGIADLRGRRV